MLAGPPPKHLLKQHEALSAQFCPPQKGLQAKFLIIPEHYGNPRKVHSIVAGTTDGRHCCLDSGINLSIELVDTVIEPSADIGNLFLADEVRHVIGVPFGFEAQGLHKLERLLAQAEGNHLVVRAMGNE